MTSINKVVKAIRSLSSEIKELAYLTEVPPLYANQVAEVLGVTKMTIWRMVNSGILTPVPGHKKPRFAWEDVIRVKAQKDGKEKNS